MLFKHSVGYTFLVRYVCYYDAYCLPWVGSPKSWERIKQNQVRDGAGPSQTHVAALQCCSDVDILVTLVVGQVLLRILL